MIYTDLTRKAMTIAFAVHKDQLDKADVPYIYHPIHLAESMDDEYSTVVALLHDVVEDSEMTFDELIAIGFPNEVITALKLLTHSPGVGYLDYIEAISHNELATKVKLADIKHNSDVTRLITVTDKDIERFEKYKKAVEILNK